LRESERLGEDWSDGGVDGDRKRRGTEDEVAMAAKVAAMAEARARPTKGNCEARAAAAGIESSERGLSYGTRIEVIVVQQERGSGERQQGRECESRASWRSR
jgi:hypothetical protein